VTGLTSIIDLAVGPDGKLYVAQLDDASWRAVEEGGGVGGSVHACDIASGSCQTVVSHVPILTSIAFRGSTLWGCDLGTRSRAGRRRPAGAVVDTAGVSAAHHARRLALCQSWTDHFAAQTTRP
jgi:hypothetical protein